jgi:hypothetical protein
MRRAASIAAFTAGSSTAAKKPIMAITTKSSTSVKPGRRSDRRTGRGKLQKDTAHSSRDKKNHILAELFSHRLRDVISSHQEI